MTQEQTSALQPLFDKMQHSPGDGTHYGKIRLLALKVPAPNVITSQILQSLTSVEQLHAELLEALEAAVNHMRDPHPAGDDLSYILDAADAVIAKARGQS